ncbi:MAG TPA: hypothetical protein VLA82_05680 [Actinomycetota bacterium]|nr:hypothetical protein [Actinomycetota bacterium]
MNAPAPARPAARRLVLAAVSVIALGVAAGAAPFSVKDEPCGSAFRPSSEVFAADLADTWSDASDIADNATSGSHRDACEERRAELRLGAIILITIGALGMLGLALPKLAIPDVVDVG